MSPWVLARMMFPRAIHKSHLPLSIYMKQLSLARRCLPVCLFAILLAPWVCGAADDDTVADTKGFPEQKQVPDNASPERSSQSDTAATDTTKSGYLKTFINDEYHLWTAPFRPSNYDSHAMKKYGLPFILISGALIATDHKTADFLP